jgi:hypothetical protein
MPAMHVSADRAALSVPLSLGKAAEENEPYEADDQPPPEAPEDNQDDPHDDEDPAKADAAVTAPHVRHLLYVAVRE